MLISIRGTNGSAKSTVIRKFMEGLKYKPIYGALGNRHPESYQVTVPGCKRPVFILGPYTTTQCGGCDRFRYDTVLELIRKYEKRGHVIFEGVIITSVYGRVGALLEEFKKNSIFVLLDTPLETCLQRVEARRGRPRDDRLIKNVRTKHRQAININEKVATDGIMQAYTVSAEKAPALMMTLLKNGKAS